MYWILPQKKVFYLCLSTYFNLGTFKVADKLIVYKESAPILHCFQWKAKKPLKKTPSEAGLGWQPCGPSTRTSGMRVAQSGCPHDG